MIDAHTISEKQIVALDLEQKSGISEKTELFARIWSSLATRFWHCGETASKSSHAGFRGLL